MGAPYLIICDMWVQTVIKNIIIYSLQFILFGNIFLFHVSEEFRVRLFFSLKQDSLF